MQAAFLAENAVREEPWQKRALGAGHQDDDPHSAQRVFRSAQMSAPVPAAKSANDHPDTTKSADPKTATKDKLAKQAKRTASLPPGFFLSPYQERQQPHPAMLPARIIEKQFDPKAMALKLLEDQEKTTQRTLPPPKEVKEGEAEEDELEVVTEEPPRVLNKAQEDAIAIFKATKAAYLNAKNYDEMDLLKSYLEQVILLFWVVQKFLPWKEILMKHLDRWNPYTERKHIKVLENNKNSTKVNKEKEKTKPYKIPKLNRSKPQALGSKPYKQKPKKGKNKWKETFRMAQVLMEVKDAIEE
ncbi:hypothetical protein PTTG_10693 [Puccinia triticina 1-1 BBBD Race 1]|uniref:Uncharacterized protein n=1 Tax=Puccinia triticina (isolate 1-1 / race 1 (BBBD)) TaxID=630390 RepID=A0A180FYT8_PUCT1|nr:hypothetical protein PTTG_10693 [Puccinia triticina 1-1 BBBD Race 1]